MVRWDAGASGVQVAADAAVAAVPRFHRSDPCPRDQRSGQSDRTHAQLSPDRITAVVLARNEERTIARALNSLPSGMPVFVLDAESSDNTVALATELGATVERRTWTGFVGARRYALSRVTTQWTFMLDADEALDPNLSRALIDASEDAEAYIVRRTSWFCGRPIRRWTGEPLVRLFRTDRAQLEAHPETGGSGDVHERWVVGGRVGELGGSLVHYSYPSIASYRQKFAEYTTLESLGLRSSVPRLGFVAVRAGARFLAHLVLRGMLFDGWRGLYVGFWSELYPIVVHWKALRRR